MGWLLAAGGAFTICGVAFGWEWFVNHWNARVLTRLLGEGGARILFGLVGAVILILGLLMEMGVIRGSR